MWTKEELERLAEICVKNNCLIFSDEIHCELLAPGAEHTVQLAYRRKLSSALSLYVASKTFNIAGLATSFVIIPNDELRRAIAARAVITVVISSAL